MQNSTANRRCHSQLLGASTSRQDGFIPTRINDIVLKADDTGVYRGECAEFCGLQHAHMRFMVVVQSQQDFDNWISTQQQPAAAPTDAPTATQGQQVFLTRGLCVLPYRAATQGRRK